MRGYLAELRLKQTGRRSLSHSPAPVVRFESLEPRLALAAFHYGDHIQAAGTVNVRQLPTTAGWVNTTLPTGTQGTIYSNAFNLNGNTWYYVLWSNGAAGYSLEGELANLASQPHSLVVDHTPPAFVSTTLNGVSAGTLSNISLGESVVFAGSVSDDTGLANITITVAGPKGSFTVNSTNVTGLSKSLATFSVSTSDATFAGVPGLYTITLAVRDQSNNAASLSWNVSFGVRRITAAPNEVLRPAHAPTDTSPAYIQPFLKRADGNAIVLDVPTWVVIHGRNDNVQSFTGPGRLATLLGQKETTDQVLVLDWRQGAQDNSPTNIGLDGAGWIPNVAEWATEKLEMLGLSGSNIFLVGHSWGTYVAYEIASRITGGVESIVALDPARAGGNVPGLPAGLDDTYDDYDETQINFAQVSQVAWAIYGEGIYGSAQLAATADYALAIDYAGANSGNPDSGERHSAAIRVFEKLLRPSMLFWAPMLSLDNFKFGEGVAPWVDNQYSAGSTGDTSALAITREASVAAFEGVFEVSEKNGNWESVDSFRYISTSGHSEVTLLSSSQRELALAYALSHP